MPCTHASPTGAATSPLPVQGIVLAADPWDEYYVREEEYTFLRSDHFFQILRHGLDGCGRGIEHQSHLSERGVLLNFGLR